MRRETMNWKKYAGGLVLMATLAMSGCRDAGTGPEIGLPDRIELAQSALHLGSLGERMTIQATVLDQFGQPMPRASILFTVEDPSVLIVGSSGEVVALANGETVVNLRVEISRRIATESGYRRGLAEASLPVVVRQEVGSVTLGDGLGEGAPPLVLWALGQRRQLQAEVRDPLGSLLARPVQVSFESEAPEVVSVSALGEVRAIEDGTGHIRIVAEGVTGRQTINVRSGFQFAACVSSNASRVAQRLAGEGVGREADTNRCADFQFRAVRHDPLI